MSLDFCKYPNVCWGDVSWGREISHCLGSRSGEERTPAQFGRGVQGHCHGAASNSVISTPLGAWSDRISDISHHLKVQMSVNTPSIEEELVEDHAPFESKKRMDQHDLSNTSFQSWFHRSVMSRAQPCQHVSLRSASKPGHSRRTNSHHRTQSDSPGASGTAGGDVGLCAVFGSSVLVSTDEQPIWSVAS